MNWRNYSNGLATATGESKMKEPEKVRLCACSNCHYVYIRKHSDFCIVCGCYDRYSLGLIANPDYKGDE